MRDDLSKQGRLYNFNALDVYDTLTKCNEQLGLPHSIHAHVEGYENEQGKKNLIDVLERIKNLDLKTPENRSQIFHLAHASSYNIDGDNTNIIKFFNANQSFDLDLGLMSFNTINPIITSDRRLINSLIKSDNPHKLIRSAVEFEGDLFATFRRLDKSNERECFMWGNAIELALNIKNKYQIQFSINFPNYANVTDIPEISTILMNEKARTNYIEGMNQSFKNKTNLLNNPESLSFNDFIIITRASPAKALGLGKIKGNLGIGADGDVNVLDININEIDITKDINRLKKTLGSIELVIKSGEIIKKSDSITLQHQGKILWSKGNAPDDTSGFVMTKKKEFYQKYYSNFYDSMKNSIKSIHLRKID